MTIKTDLGYIEITTEVLAGIAGYAASLCFGVKGMTIRSMTDGLAHLLGRENQSRGVKVTEAPDGAEVLEGGELQEMGTVYYDAENNTYYIVQK